MNKVEEALDRLWSETFGNNETSSMSNRSDRDLIKQALQDKDKRIKELDKSDTSKEEYMINYYNEMTSCELKLNAIEEMLESDNPMSYRLAMIRELLRSDR